MERLLYSEMHNYCITLSVLITELHDVTHECQCAWSTATSAMAIDKIAAKEANHRVFNTVSAHAHIAQS